MYLMVYTWLLSYYSCFSFFGGVFTHCLLWKWLGNHCIGFLRGQYQRIHTPGVLEPCHQEGFVSFLCSGKARMSSRSRVSNNNNSTNHKGTLCTYRNYTRDLRFNARLPCVNLTPFLSDGTFHCQCLPIVQSKR